MSKTSSTTLPSSHFETSSNDQSIEQIESNNNNDTLLDDNNDYDEDDDDEYEIEYEYKDENDTNSCEHEDEEDKEYCRISDRIDELLNKANNLKAEVDFKNDPSNLNKQQIPKTESLQSAMNDEEYEYEYEYDDEESDNMFDNRLTTRLTCNEEKSQFSNNKEFSASEAIKQASFQLPDFGQLRHASNKWNIAAISGEDAEANFDGDGDECNEIEIALEEPTAKIVGQLEQLLEEDEQDDVDELMPDALIQKTPTSNPLLLGEIDLPLSPSPGPSPLLNHINMDEKSGDLLQQIRSAALNNDVNTFCTILDNNVGFFIDTILKAGWTALMYGAYRSNVDIVKQCLLRGADPNYHKEYFTPLMAVCCSRLNTFDYISQTFTGHERMLEILNLLIDAGGCVHLQDKFGCTALQYAARFGRLQLVIALLDSGAQIDARNCNGWTALHWAAAERHGDVVDALLIHGSDPNIKTIDSKLLELTPGELAAMKGYEDISEQILNASFQKQNNEIKMSSFQTYLPALNSDLVCEQDNIDLSPKQIIQNEMNEQMKEFKVQTNCEPKVQIQLENEQLEKLEQLKTVSKVLQEDSRTHEDMKEENKQIKENERVQNEKENEEKNDEIKMKNKRHDKSNESNKSNGSNIESGIESEHCNDLLNPIDTINSNSSDIELSFKQMQENVNNLTGSELRKRTTLVIDEWDEDTKRILANKTKQSRRSSIEEADGRNIIVSLVIAALLFLFFRIIFSVIFS